MADFDDNIDDTFRDTTPKIIVRSVCYSILFGGLFPPLGITTDPIGAIFYSGILGGVSFAWSYFTTWLEKLTKNMSFAAEFPFACALCYIVITQAPKFK